MSSWRDRHPRLVRWTVDLALFAFSIFHGVEVLRDPTGLAYAVTVFSSLGIFIRRERPITSLLVGVPGLILADAIVTPVAALFSLGVRYSDRRILGLAVVAVVLGYTAFWRGWENLTHATLVITYSVAVSVGALAVGVLVRTRRELGESFAALEAAQDQLIEQAENRARAQERTHLAREMHDVVAHQVTLIAVESGALTVTSKDPDAQRAASTIRTLATRTIEELRQMLHLLRSSGAGPTELGPPMTAGDIPALVADSGLNATLDLRLPEGLPPTLQRTAYRTVQEGLTNVERYAPDAEVAVTCRVVGDRFLVSVENGPSSAGVTDLPSTGQGHRGLAERAALLGGSFNAGPTAEGGYRVGLEVGLDRLAPAPGGRSGAAQPVG